MVRTKKTARLSCVAQYPQAKRRRVEKEAPLAEQAPLEMEEEYFSWFSSDNEGERNLEDDEDAATASDEDGSLQLRC
jgi:hypothetical protein